jgi:hypothetical protein
MLSYVDRDLLAKDRSWIDTSGIIAEPAFVLGISCLPGDFFSAPSAGWDNTAQPFSSQRLSPPPFPSQQFRL